MKRSEKRSEKMTIRKAVPWVILATVLLVVNIRVDTAYGRNLVDHSVGETAVENTQAEAGQSGASPTGQKDAPILIQSQDGQMPDGDMGAVQEIAAEGLLESPLEDSSIPAPTESASLTAIIEETQVLVQGQVTGQPSNPAYYDQYLYLFELQPYEDEIGGRTDYIARFNKGEAVTYTVPLGLRTSEEKLYSSFILAAYDGTRYREISNRAYLSNPEAVAKKTAPYKEPLSKKGLLLDGDMISDAMYLGVKNSSVSIALQQILGEGIQYEYGGKTYHFNKEMVEYYDNAVFTMSSKDISITAIILNGWNDTAPQLIPAGVEKTSGVNYYNFNASTEEGVETIKAAASFLAERYSGGEGTKGKISNWVIGNEINNQIWNYIGPMELEAYVKEYIKAFRLFYTTIRSVSQNDRVFFSTDFYWNHPEESDTYYSAKDVIDTFARLSREEGDMDWGLAYHPYPDPLTEPEFWDDGLTGRAVDSIDTPIVNFNNLHILTDHLQQAQLLDKNGDVRHIILSEQGFTSRSATRGDVEQIQAAALAYAYFIADSNPYIDAVLMHRQVDHVSEVNAYVAVGLWECDMSSPHVIRPTMRKKAWEVFKYMDTNQAVERTDFAREIIGIEKWSDVIPDFRWWRYE